MKYVKTMFLISLFNFLLVGAIVLAADQVRPKEVINEGQKMMTPTITEATLTIALLPTETATPKPTKIKDPFSAIFEGPAPTNKPAAQNNNPTIVQNQSPTTPPAAPTTDNRCIISIDGQKYDVTVFRSLHSGGDIFQCGSDMSSVFHNQHPNSFLNQLGKYRI